MQATSSIYDQITAEYSTLLDFVPDGVEEALREAITTVEEIARHLSANARAFATVCQ